MKTFGNAHVHEHWRTRKYSVETGVSEESCEIGQAYANEAI